MKRNELKVGTPATIILLSDTRCAVVVKVNPKSVLVRRVERDMDSMVVTNPGEPFPCIIYDGVLDKPVGEPERYRIAEYDDGTVYGMNGSVHLRFGFSQDRTDYRY